MQFSACGEPFPLEKRFMRLVPKKSQSRQSRPSTQIRSQSRPSWSRPSRKGRGNYDFWHTKSVVQAALRIESICFWLGNSNHKPKVRLCRFRLGIVDSWFMASGNYDQSWKSTKLDAQILTNKFTWTDTSLKVSWEPHQPPDLAFAWRDTEIEICFSRHLQCHVIIIWYL